MQFVHKYKCRLCVLPEASTDYSGRKVVSFVQLNSDARVRDPLSLLLHSKVLDLFLPAAHVPLISSFNNINLRSPLDKQHLAGSGSAFISCSFPILVSLSLHTRMSQYSYKKKIRLLSQLNGVNVDTYVLI